MLEFHPSGNFCRLAALTPRFRSLHGKSLRARLPPAIPSKNTHKISQCSGRKACCVAVGYSFKRHITFSPWQARIAHIFIKKKHIFHCRARDHFAVVREIRLAASTRFFFIYVQEVALCCLCGLMTRPRTTPGPGTCTCWFMEQQGSAR